VWLRSFGPLHIASKVGTSDQFEKGPNAFRRQ
jgi:hypothetical protein